MRYPLDFSPPLQRKPQMFGARSGGVILETAMLIPVIVLLLVGMAQIAKFTYTYIELRKVVYSVATYLTTQPGVGSCNYTEAINFGMRGTQDESQPVFVSGLTADMIQIGLERIDALGAIYPVTECDGTPPGYIVVSVNGYSLQPRIPFLSINAIPLRPQVKVPYGGT